MRPAAFMVCDMGTEGCIRFPAKKCTEHVPVFSAFKFIPHVYYYYYCCILPGL